jgi:DNA modification methylase
MKIKTLDDLTPDARNARKHNPRNIGMIAESLGKVGAARSIVIDEAGNILAGNGTVEALAEVGIHKVKVIESDGNEIIAVQRKGLSPEQKIELAIADNRTAELAEWDIPTLKEFEIGMPGLLDNMFTPIELDDLFKLDIDIGPQEGEDDAPEPPEEPTTKAGDLYQLGEHRLLCGDSTDKETVDRLMDGQKADMVFTDPPYGVDYEGGHLNPYRKKLIGDDGDIYSDVVPVIAQFLDGPCYIWFAGSKALPVYSAVSKIGEIHALLIWHKTNATYAAMNAQYKQRHEPCLYWKPKGSSLRWCGATTECTIWEMKRDPRNDMHPTQKPVELPERAIGNHKASKVLDLFGGSGSTMIACEKLERKCYMMEIDPAYCDVIVKRWEDFTGEKADLITNLVETSMKLVLTESVDSDS